MQRRSFLVPRPGRAARALRIVVLACFAWMQAATAAPVPAPVPTPASLGSATRAPTRPLLWKVSDGDNAVYVLGSFHLLGEADYPLPAEVDAAFDAARRVVFEVAPADFEHSMRAGPARTPGAPLRDVLPPAVREKLAVAVLETGQSLAAFDAMEPWAANMSLVTGITHALGLSASRGLDQHLMRRAADARKPTAGLETVAEQQRALAGASLSEQIRALNDLLDNRQAMSRAIADLHAAWRAGDVPRLDQLARRSMREQNPESYRLLNVERNQRWLPMLQAMLDASRDDALVVVGSLHVLGDDGVVEGLRARGYRVERLCTGCTANELAAH